MICIFIYSKVKEVSKLAIIYMQVKTSWQNIEPIYSDIYVKKACSDKNLWPAAARRWVK